jgi:hypothetical protein
MVIERPYTSASNRARIISEGISAAKAKWEADTYSKHFSYRLKGKTGTRRPVPTTSVKSLATRVYRLKCTHAPTGVELKWFSHREDDKCSSSGLPLPFVRALTFSYTKTIPTQEPSPNQTRTKQ